MKHARIQAEEAFSVLFGNSQSQAAEMVVQPGAAEGGPGNRHRGSDQWLYVLSGHGEAEVDGEKVELREGSLLLIERGETHEIRNTGSEALRTLNFYVPPAYTQEGEELSAAQS